MKIRHIAIAALLSAGIAAATAQQIATPRVKSDFRERQEKVGNPAYFAVFDRQLTPQQREALEFLYAYMPLPDMADNSGEFFLSNVDATLRARQEMPSGAISCCRCESITRRSTITAPNFMPSLRIA